MIFFFFYRNIDLFHTFSFNKMHLKMSSAKWRPFCLGLDVLNSGVSVFSTLYKFGRVIIDPQCTGSVCGFLDLFSLGYDYQDHWCQMQCRQDTIPQLWAFGRRMTERRYEIHRVHQTPESCCIIRLRGSVHANRRDVVITRSSITRYWSNIAM